MKRNKIVAGLIGVMLIVVMCVAIVFTGTVETVYNRQATVTNVKGNKITFECGAGFTWVWVGKGFHEGDNVILIMDNNHTDTNVLDDKIIDVHLYDQ